MKVKESTDELNIETGYKDQKKNRNFCGCDQDKDNNRGSWNCVCLETSYEIWLPKNTILKMETINGNIEIRGLESDISINSINGFVDIAYNAQTKANLDFSTINGDIFTDFDITGLLCFFCNTYFICSNIQPCHFTGQFFLNIIF